MKTKLLATIALTGLLGTSLYAANGNMDGMKNGCPANKMDKKMMKKHKKQDRGILSELRKLNLSPEQKDKIVKIREDILKNRVKISVAFTKSGFDKDKFIKIMEQKRENMLKSKAEMIDRIYKDVLTSKQKEQFKVLIDLKEDRMDSMRNQRINFDKNFNGRR